MIYEKYSKMQEQKKSAIQEMTGVEDVRAHTFDELAQPKDTCKVGKTLMELEKKFPMDEIVRKMKKEEFNTNRARNAHLFRYPEEYQVFNEEEEVKRRMLPGKKPVILNPQEKEEKEAQRKKRRKTHIETLKRGTVADTAEEKEKKMQKIRDKKPIVLFLHEAIQGFFKSKGKRLEEKIGTLRNFIGEQYLSLCSSYPEEMGRLFPFPDYGLHKKDSEEGAKRKIYPREFKSFFLEVMRSYAPDGKGGYVKVHRKVTPFWIPSSKPCKTSDKGISIGESVAKSTNAKGKKKKCQKNW
eukprot:TRINITY_DN2055_c0_g1_i2.p1 TRINITY_DN2055_c0_g1~~TRINITY_DN2055_c0_g1_i2.p1  ORF type:complete len:297 (-),score=72.15 TRINITY_DN2055_c0_g1_i2:1058-1948(-)